MNYVTLHSKLGPIETFFEIFKFHTEHSALLSSIGYETMRKMGALAINIGVFMPQKIHTDS